MSFGESQIFEIFKPHGLLFFSSFWFAPLFCDIWRVFKIRGINFGIQRGYLHPYHLMKYGKWCAVKKTFWVNWWTPKWHEGRGPYITIGLGLFTIMRGY